MKKTSVLEKIGVLLLIIGFIALIIDFSWENNPTPIYRKTAIFLNSIGLVALGIGRLKRQKKEKSKKNTDK